MKTTEEPIPRDASLLDGLIGIQHGYLTKTEEARLGRIAMAGRAADRKASTPEGRAAEAEIVGHWMQLAVSYAKLRTANRQYDFEEVIACCLTGLAEAATVFNPDLGRFSTIARRYMQKHLGDAWGQFRPIPVRRGVINRYNQIRRRGARTKGQARMADDYERVAEVCRIGDDRDEGEYDPVAPVDDHLVAEEREHTASVLREILSPLTAEQRQILSHRFGIRTSPKSLVNTGRELGICGERVRQIQEATLAQLRQAARAAL